MNIVNISNPGQPLAAGDLVEYHHDNGAVERKRYFDAPPLQMTLVETKAAKIAAIRAYFQAVVDSIKAAAAPYEVATWETQRAEFMAWSANNATPTPYVSGLASARGLTVAELMAKIAPKVSGMATIQGTQHRMEKLVEAATSIAEVEAVTW